MKILKKMDKQNMLCMLLLTLVPLLSCIHRMALDGRGLWDFHLAATIGNDEVFYYKYVEGVLAYGHPMGFFGFNESRALLGGGTAWSPAISWYWIILGKLFTWNYVMPMVCNLLVMSLAMFAFAVIVRPTRVQTLAIAGLYLCYGQVAYYTLSGVPECIIYALVILFMAGVFKGWQAYDRSAAVITWITAFFLTIMRPYYIVLFFIPLYYLWQKSRKAALFTFFAGTVSTAGIYAFFNKYMTASYFGQSVLTRALNPKDFADGPVRAVKNLIKTGLYGLKKSFVWMGAAFTDGSFQGRMLIALTFMLLLICILFWIKRREKRSNILLFFFVLYYPIRFAAAVYLYDKNIPPEAIRHAYDFIFVAGLLIIMLLKPGKVYGAICAGMAFVLIGTQFLIPMWYSRAEGNSLDYASKEEVQAIRQTEEEFADIFTVQGREISYENDIIWVFVDEVGGERKLMKWKAFYGLPAGMALNICFADYVTENFDSLQSAYIATVPEGKVSLLCREKAAELVYSSKDMEIYQINGADR